MYRQDEPQKNMGGGSAPLAQWIKYYGTDTV